MKRFKLTPMVAMFVLLFLLPTPSVALNTDWAHPMVSNAIYAAGFKYNADQAIYMTRHQALQRKFGFNNIYDKMAAPVGMAIEVEPVRFEYDGKGYMVELWKGQYFSAIGAEIGFYVGTKLTIAGERHYRCATTDEELDIAFTLKNDGYPEYSVSGKHWWLTGFKLGIFAHPEQLTLEDIEITFQSTGMAEAFAEALNLLGYSADEDGLWCEESSVGFVFSTPKNIQPWDQDKMGIVLAANKKRTAGLKGFKWAFGLEDFSPESIAEGIEENAWYGLLLYTKFKLMF